MASLPSFAPAAGSGNLETRELFHLRLALLQINPTAGDLEGNAALIVRAAREAQTLNADLAVTPELALMGYLPRDLLMSRGSSGAVVRC